MRAVLVLAGAMLLPLLARPAPLSAHAYLSASDPPAQSVLARAPARVQLTFSEEVVPRDIDVTVLDAQRRRVDRGDAALLPGTKDAVGISLLDNLPGGVYTVSWGVVSAVDAHATRGLFPFTVGDPGTVPGAAVDVRTEASSGGFLGVIARWATSLAALVITGLFAFVPLVLTRALALLDTFAPAGQRGRDRGETAVTAEETAHVATGAIDRLQWAAVLTLAVYAAGLILLLLVDTATASGGSYRAALGRPMWDLLSGTSTGARWLVRGAILVLIGGGLWWLDRHTREHGRAAIEQWWTWTLLAVLGAAALLAQSLGSHAAALRSQEALAAAIDWVHLVAAAVWVGGLVAFALALLPALAPLGGPPRTRLLAGLIPRFTRVAGASVVVVTATGIYQTVRLLGGWGEFTAIAWGRALLVKLVLFAMLLALAAFNMLAVRPWLARLETRMDRPARETAARVRTRFRRALLAEASVAVLVLLAVGVLTGEAPGASTAAEVATGPSRPIILTIPAEDLNGRIVIAPGRVGLNRFDFTITDQGGTVVPDGTEVVMRVSTLDQDTGVTEAPTEALGAGRYTVTGSYLSTIGFWEVAAVVRRPGRDEVKIPFQFTLGSGNGGAAVRENRPAAPIARGRELFQNNCAICHGEGAHGDGPAAAALNPKPLDLTVHVPLHSDTELHDWIANGIPRTSMQGWSGQFSDEEIQAIINYLRQVADQANQDR